MNDIIYICKHYIENDSLKALQEYVITLIEDDHDWAYIFHKVYLHACLKGNEETAKWLQSAIYPIMDPIQQIGLRHVFTYGKLLLARAATRAKSTT